MICTLVLPFVPSGVINAGTLQSSLVVDVAVTDWNVSASLHWNWMLAAAAFWVAHESVNRLPDWIVVTELARSLADGFTAGLPALTVNAVESARVPSYIPDTIEGRTRTDVEIGESELFTAYMVIEPDVG